MLRQRIQSPELAKNPKKKMLVELTRVSGIKELEEEIQDFFFLFNFPGKVSGLSGFIPRNKRVRACKESNFER